MADLEEEKRVHEALCKKTTRELNVRYSANLLHLCSLFEEALPHSSPSV